jgi:geranylgeranyl pyrophosphate synthase
MMQTAFDVSLSSTLGALLEAEARGRNSAIPPDVHVPERLWQRALFEPLREACGRPGKEFRGRLCGVAWELAGGRGHAPAELGAAVEALHLGSLIVDDIEDGSTRRRGGPSLHRIVGVPLALNAGNWLYFWASELLSRAKFQPELELSLRAAVDRAVLRCHYGQALDLSVRVTELRQREVPDIVFGTTRLKTGSLMELAAELGGLAARAEPRKLQALAALGRDIGIALQMLDDLTGITSERRCHKGHEDLLEARPSWVWAWLAERLDDVTYLRLRALEEAVVRHDLHPEVVAEQLREFIGEHGRAAVHERLAASLDGCREAFGPSPGLQELAHELARLERYDG